MHVIYLLSFNDNQYNYLRDDNRDDGSTMNEFLNSRNVCDPSWVPIQKYTSEEDRVSLGGSVFDTIFNDTKNYTKNDMRNDMKSDARNDTKNDVFLDSNTNNNNNRKFGTNTTTSTTTGTSTPLGTNVNNNNISSLSLPSSPSGSNVNNFGDKLKFTASSDNQKNINNISSSENIWGINEIQEESLDTERNLVRSKSISTIQEISKDDHYVTDDARTYVQPTESRRRNKHVRANAEEKGRGMVQ